MELTTPKRHLRKRVRIPIYGANLWIVVTDSIGWERAKMKHIFGPSAPSEFSGSSGLCIWHSNNFAIILDKEDLNIEVLSHEVYHLTNGILSWSGAHIVNNNDEHGAILHGYLMDLVYWEVRDYIKPC